MRTDVLASLEARLSDVEAALKIAPPLPEKPGGPDNWIERKGVRRAGGRGLPPYIDKVARSLFHKNKARFPTVGAAVATAVSKSKRWCLESTNARVKALACNAVRQWMQMRARAGGGKATKAAFKSALVVDPTRDIHALDDYDRAFLAFLGYGVPEDFEIPELTETEEAELLATVAPVDTGTEAPPAEALEVGDEAGEEPDAGEDGGAPDGEEGAPELTGPIVGKSATRQVAYAPVLVPGEPDVDGDVVTAEKIQEVAWDFIANHRYMDEQHRLDGQVAVPVESYILQRDMEVEIAGKSEVLPEGTWILGAHFPDAGHWQRVMDGELEGLSITAVRKSDFEAAIAKAQASESVAVKSGEVDEPGLVQPHQRKALTRVTIRDLGEDWIGPAVSVVRGPAVPKAKWFAFKSREQEQPKPADEKPKGLFERMAEAVMGNDAQTSTETGEVMDVKISQEELDRRIEAAAEAKVAEILSQMEDEETEETEDEEDEEVFTFESEEAMQSYVREQAEAALAEALEADEDDEDDDASEEVAELKEELAAVKSQLVKLGARGLDRVEKSRQINGNGDDSVPKPFNMNEYLGRDAMGNYVGRKN